MVGQWGVPGFLIESEEKNLDNSKIGSDELGIMVFAIAVVSLMRDL